MCRFVGLAARAENCYVPSSPDYDMLKVGYDTCRRRGCNAKVRVIWCLFPSERVGIVSSISGYSHLSTLVPCFRSAGLAPALQMPLLPTVSVPKLVKLRAVTACCRVCRLSSFQIWAEDTPRWQLSSFGSGMPWHVLCVLSRGLMLRIHERYSQCRMYDIVCCLRLVSLFHVYRRSSSSPFALVLKTMECPTPTSVTDTTICCARPISAHRLLATIRFEPALRWASPRMDHHDGFFA